MSVYDLLSAKEDSRKGNSNCLFNGYLEDYLELEKDESIKDILTSLFTLNNNFRIIVDYYISVSKESISNSIIRYKDIYKSGDKALKISYIVYGKQNNHAKAIMLINDNYIYAKGLYYALTDSGSHYQEYANDILVLTLEDKEEIINAYNNIYEKRTGLIQRELDKKYFENYDEALKKAIALAEELKENIYEKIENASNKEEYIRSIVAKFYLLKKFVYVQCMIDKNLLTERYEGNIRYQRNQAKTNADAIRFISLSELWKGENKQ